VRILILNWRYVGHPKAGGAEIWTQRIAEELIDLGHQVTVFTSAVEGRPAHEELSGITIIRRGGPISLYHQAKKYLTRCGSQFDYIIDEVNTRPFFAHQYSQTPSRAMFHQIASDVWDYEASRPIALLGRYFLEPYWLRQFRNRGVLVLSNSTAKSLVARRVQVLEVVPPGVDALEVPNRQKSTRPTICFLGRLVPSKRPLDVLRAFELVQERIEDVHLILIGDGPLRKSIENLTNLSVEVTGRIPDEERNRLVQSAHVLVATSVREGWGMNVTEAAELGTPTIAYDVPGLRDSVTAVGGALVPETPADLASALIEFFDTSQKLEVKKFERSWRDAALDFERIMLSDLSWNA
jgi:glycosyltransferase involved in cell wall biosynthesis